MVFYYIEILARVHPSDKRNCRTSRPSGSLSPPGHRVTRMAPRAPLIFRSCDISSGRKGPRCNVDKLLGCIRARRYAQARVGKYKKKMYSTLVLDNTNGES